MWFVALLAACGGRSPEQRVWDGQMEATRDTARVWYVQRYDAGWVTTGLAERGGSGPIDEEHDCDNGGTAKLFTDGTLCFEDCEVAGTRFDGTIVADDTRFQFESFQVGKGDPPGIVDGGYTWEGDNLVLDQTFTWDDGEYGGLATSHMTGSVVTNADGTVSGSLSVRTDWESSEPMQTSCTFVGASLADLVAVSKGDDGEAAMQKLCPQVWDEEITVTVHVSHDNLFDDENIHILVPGDGFDESQHVRPGQSKKRTFKATRGEDFEVSYGRGDVVWGSTWCPRATDLYDLYASYTAAGLLICLDAADWEAAGG